MLGKKKYIRVREEYFGETAFEARINFSKYKEHKLNNQGYSMTGVIEASPIYCLAPLQPTMEAVPVKKNWTKLMSDCMTEPKQEGKTPMRYNDNYASAHATVAAPVSDTSVQRDYLLSRLNAVDYPKQKELVKLFNLYVNNTPKTYKDLIDAIKNDKFTIDKKVQKRLEVAEENDDEDEFFFGGPFTGIIWAGPQPDREGYDAACKEKTKQYNTAQDAIMSGIYADGLKALQDFEAWLPETGAKAN